MDSMSKILDLSFLNYNRCFVIGDLFGDYSKLMNILYEQNFNYNDILIFTGNFLYRDNTRSLDCYEFIKNSVNVYSVYGAHEHRTLLNIQQNNENILPFWLKEYPKKEEFINFIETLPSIIKVSDYLFIVNSGIEPYKTIELQYPDVFYSIKTFDKDSKFYQTTIENEWNWYDYDYDGMKFCFSNCDAGSLEVSAGYCLSREYDSKLKCLIFSNVNETPILISEGEIL